MGEIIAIGSNATIAKTEEFSSFFIAFSGSTQNFAYFQKKDQLHSLNILEVLDPDNCGYFSAPKLLF